MTSLTEPSRAPLRWHDVDAADVAILRELAWNPEDPRHVGRSFQRPWDVAKRLRLHRNTVVRRLQALADAGVYQGTHLYVAPELDGVRLGLYEFAFGEDKPRGLARLREDPRVLEMHDFHGGAAWAAVSVPTGDALATAAEELRTRSGALRVELVSTWDWPRPLRPAGALDMRILRALHEDAFRPVAEVAAEVGVTPKTVRLRLKALAAAHAFTVIPALSLAQVRGAVAFVLAVRFPSDARARSHAALLERLPNALLAGAPREETTWVFVVAPDTANVEATRRLAASMPGASDARVLLASALLDG